MSCVEDLCRHVFGLGIAGRPARGALYNFLSYTRDPRESVTNGLIEDFFHSALAFQHWNARAKELYEHTLEDLFEFELSRDNPLSLVEIPSPDSLQLIEIASPKDSVAVVDRYFREKFKITEGVRTVCEPHKHLLTFRRLPDQEVFVHTLEGKFTIENGQLRPLNDLCGVLFDANLEVKEEHPQLLATASGSTYIFRQRGGLISGFLIKGAFFQAVERYDNKQLKEIPKLFFGLKRIEQFLLSKETNPFYREIVALMEQTICLVEQRDPQIAQFGPNVLEKGQLALELIFPNDKLMTLLLRELARSLANAGILTAKVEANSWSNPPQKSANL